jgi:hypothetical protein
MSRHSAAEEKSSGTGTSGGGGGCETASFSAIHDDAIAPSLLAYRELKSLLRFCREHDVRQLFDGKTLIDASHQLESTVAVLLQTEIPESDKRDCIVRAADDFLGADNSCGATANRLCQLFLGPGHDMDDLSKGYTPIGSFITDLTLKKERGFPQLIRFELKRYNEFRDSWIGAHSYVVLAHSTDTINVLQAYFGEYNLADAIHSSRQKALDAMDLSTYLCAVVDLLADSPEKRASAYSGLYRSGVAVDGGSFPKYQIICRAEPVDSAAAISRIRELDTYCKATCASDPLLKAGRGFEAAVREKVYRSQSTLAAELLPEPQKTEALSCLRPLGSLAH